MTGQWHWRLEESGNLWSTLQAKFPVYPDLLEETGYYVGYTGKGWGPGKVEIGGRNKVANIPTPVVRGNHVFVTTSYKTGSALLKLSREGDSIRAEEVYFLGPDQFENHHGGVIPVGEYIFGGDGQNQGNPVCLNFMTGEIVWKEKAPAGGSAAVVYADGNFIFRYDRGPVFLVEATAVAFKINGQFEPAKDRGPA